MFGDISEFENEPIKIDFIISVVGSATKSLNDGCKILTWSPVGHLVGLAI